MRSRPADLTREAISPSVDLRTCSSDQEARQTTATGQSAPYAGTKSATTCSMTWIDKWMASVARVVAKAARFSVSGIAEARPDVRVRTTDWATPGSVSSRRRLRGRGGEGRHAGRERIRDAESIEPPQLLADRAPDREVARLKSCHILALLMSADHFADDRIEIEGGGVDDARSRWAPEQHLGGNDGACVKADRASGDEISPTDGDEVGSAGASADEMDRHDKAPWARAQVTRSDAMRLRSRRAPGPAAANAAASATEPTP